MSNIDPDLLLYLALDEIRNGEFPDASNYGRNGVIKGNVALVPDDLFGACASFDGALTSFIEVADSPDLRSGGNLTIEAWINISQRQTDWVGILVKGTENQESYGLWYIKDTTWLFQSTSGSKYQRCQIDTASQPRSLNAWYHVAAVIQNNSASVYIHDAQGRFLLQQPPKAAWGDRDASTNPLRIGYAGQYKGHNGKIANVRVYKRALSQAEIERDIREDCMSLVAFRKGHPMDFRLFDEDEQAVLYITDDKAGRNLNLELRNSSAQAIQLSNGQPVASESNHHFALRFRPGTLSDNVIDALVDPAERAKILKQPAEWDLYFPAKKPAANETVSLYLLYKGESKTFQPDERRALTLRGMSAAPGSGARGTQVELVPRQMTAAGGDATPITGSRAQYLHITNQTGKKNIPLHVGFVGGNNALNDGKTQNALKLRITNVSSPKDKNTPITLKPGADNSASKFIVSFDARLEKQKKDWALVEKGDSEKVKVSADGSQLVPTDTKCNIEAEGTQGETPQWNITFNKEAAIDSGKGIDIDIANIVSSLPNGHANLYVRYENIPGYWDGQFVCPVEKGPIVYNGGNVGVGTATPAKTLDVKGNAAISGAVSVSDRLEVNGSACVSANVGIGTKTPEKPLDVKGDARISGSVAAESAIVERSNAFGTWLRLTNTSDGGENWNLISTGKDNSEGAGKLLFKQGEGAGPVRMILDNEGRVGVGTTTPAKPLDVKGDTIISGNVDIIESAPGKGGHLHVAGDVTAQAVNASALSLVGHSLKSLQAGRANVGPNTGAHKVKTIDFVYKVANIPHVIVTARNGQGGINDTFAVTVRSITTTYFVVNISRVDGPQDGWGQELYLDWIAMEFGAG